MLLSLGLLTVFLLMLHRADPSVAREHGPMENIQAAWLVLGMGALGYFASRAKDRGQRSFFAATCVFYVTFFLLEFDVRPFQKPLLTLLLNGIVRNLILAALWGSAAWLAFRNARATRLAFQSWLRSYSAVLLIAAGFCWICGAAAEKGPWEHTLFAEELCEVHATLLMALSAFQARRAMVSRRGPLESSEPDAASLPQGSQRPQQPIASNRVS